MNSPAPHSYKKATWLLGAILLTASISGFFMGLRQTGSQISLTRPVSLATEESERNAIRETNAVPVAVAYAKQDWLKEGSNRGWQNRVANLFQPPLDLSTLTNATEAERAGALRQRAARRAYDGAPPVVPHPIAQDSSAACLACHGEGLVVKDKIASKISHARYASCTQCHAPSSGLGLPLAEAELLDPIAGNTFAGAPAPFKGSRAWPQAPPTVPHATLLRSDCLSCHGPRGLLGLRTPHPDRQSCVQCHAPSAELDQHKFALGQYPE
jgi:cytochrome c-type protein NapB